MPLIIFGIILLWLWLIDNDNVFFRSAHPLRWRAGCLSFFGLIVFAVVRGIL